jgi:hypothetical protein
MLPLMNVEVSQLLERRPEMQALVEDLEHCIAEIDELGAQFKASSSVWWISRRDRRPARPSLLAVRREGDHPLAHAGQGIRPPAALPSANGRSFLQ